MSATATPARSGPRSAAASAGGRHSHHVHSPIDAASSASAASEEGLGERPRQDPGGRDRQHDALRGRDELAPAARRQRRAHPRQQPLAGEEQVARGADREHPRAVRGGDVDAEGEDQERVDLAVEARAQRGRRTGAPRHPAVDQVQRERDGGERHEQRDRRVVRERVRGQRGDADGERGPGERHPGRRPSRSPASRVPAPRHVTAQAPTIQPAAEPAVAARTRAAAPGRQPGRRLVRAGHSSRNRGESA